MSESILDKTGSVLSGGNIQMMNISASVEDIDLVIKLITGYSGLAPSVEALRQLEAQANNALATSTADWDYVKKDERLNLSSGDVYDILDDPDESKKEKRIG